MVDIRSVNNSITNWMYQLPNKKVWSTKLAKYVEEDSSIVQKWLKETNMSKIPMSPIDKNRKHTEEGLYEALVFYNLPLGELATREDLFKSLRTERDKRIQETDYMFLNDYPLSDDDRNTLTKYRQDLRDLPNQEDAPWDGGGTLTPWPTLNFNGKTNGYTITK